jgi:YVTN family beta-propeller protein
MFSTVLDSTAFVGDKMLESSSPLFASACAPSNSSSKITMKSLSAIVAYTLLLLPSSASAEWKVSKEIRIGGEGGWDYLAVEPGSRHLFVTHMNHVLVIDLKTEKTVATLDSQKAHGIAFAPELHRGFISNGDSNTVTIFDLDTLKPLQSVPVGQGPDAICYEPVTKRVLTFNGHSKSTTFIDAATGKVLGETPLPGKPEFAQADGTGFVFDNVEDKSLVMKIDAAKMTIVQQWALPPNSSPSALAIDQKNHRLFAGCDGKKLVVLDSDSGKIIDTLPIGDGVDAATFDPIGPRVFASCGDGTLTVIKEESADKFSVEQQVPTQKGARTLAFDSMTQTANLPTAKFGPAPPAKAEHLHPRGAIEPNSMKLLVVMHS